MKIFNYECVTTFWQDFTIAEPFGTHAIIDTYNRTIKHWGDNIVYMTELVMVLNHKIWQWYGQNKAISAVYNTLWTGAEDHVFNHFEGEDIQYYLRVTD